MTINERIRFLRKEELHLTLEEFGKHFGVTKVAFSKIENGQRGVTEQMVLSICREFNVNEEWLRTGEGEPFKKIQRNQQIEAFINDILRNEPEGPKARLVAALAELDEKGWETLMNLARKMVSENSEEKTEVPSAPNDATPEELETVRQLREKRKRADA